MKREGIDIEKFRGKYTHNLDQKNRLFIPAKFRDLLGEKFIVCRPLNGDRCIMVYSEQGWDEFMETVEQKYDGRELVLFKRFANANIDSAEPDKQGRVTLKTEFCQFAKLEREVFVVGAENHFEIWDINEWAEMEEKEGAFFKGFNGPY